MKVMCKLFGHKWTFENKKLLRLPFGKHHCERCGLVYKYNKSEPDRYVKGLDKHIGERMIVPRNVLCDECKEKAND